MDVDQVREEICETGRRLWQKGFCAGNDGNISVRVGEHEVVCTPTGVSKGFMRPEDLCTVDLAGRQLGGQRERTSEVLLHLEIYNTRPEVKAVVHTHSPYLTAFAVCEREIPMGFLAEMEVLIGPVPMIAYSLPGTDTLARSIREHVGLAHVAVLAHHGPVSWSTSLEDAYFKMEIAEAYCRMLTIADGLGGAKALPAEAMDGLLALKKRMGLMNDPRLCETKGRP